MLPSLVRVSLGVKQYLREILVAAVWQPPSSDVQILAQILRSQVAFLVSSWAWT